jgi:hypothetical protein
MQVDELAALLDGVRRKASGGFVALCPGHEDHDRSLSVDVGIKGLVVKCFAGCNVHQVMTAVGRTPAELFHDYAPVPNVKLPGQSVTTRYEVRRRDGTLVATQVRTDPGKKIAWQPGLNGTPPSELPLFGAHLLDTYPADATVVVTEGPKAAQSLIDRGIPAVGTYGTAATPTPTVLAELAGFHVVAWPDNDAAGKLHMSAVIARLKGMAATVRVVTWEDAPPKGDAADYAGDPWDLIDASLPPVHVARRPYRTTREISATTSTEPQWIWENYVARQAITELDGKIKAAGKTTLLGWAVRAILGGESFLEYATTKTKIIWYSEQQPGPFNEMLRQVGIGDHGNELRILFRVDARDLNWAENVAAITEDAIEDDYGLVIIDTLAKLAGIVNENDAGEWARAMDQLQVAAHRGLAVWVARHDRKGQSEIGESGRGSSQASGDVDVILRLARIRGSQVPGRRALESLSRYRATPERLVIELTDDGYVNVTAAEIADAAKEKVLGFVSARASQKAIPVFGQKWIEPGTASEADVIDGVSLPRTTVQRALHELVIEGRVVIRGGGVRGDPFRYGAAT